MKKIILFFCSALLSQFSMAQQVTIPSVIKGITIMLEYKDYKIPETVQEVSDLMNKQGYTGNNQLGSVRDFYYTQSNGKVTITSTVVRVTLPENYAYYHTNGRNYVNYAIEQLNQSYPNGFQDLTADPMDGALLHMNFIERGAEGAGVTNGVSKDLYIKNTVNGVPGLIKVGQGNIYGVNNGTPFGVSTICHEMGHSVFSWTDYYQTAFSNLGDFDVMGSAGTDRGPMPLCPALRLQRGWIDNSNIIEISGTVAQTCTLTANDYTKVYRYKNPDNPEEYLLFNALKHGGYYQSFVNSKTMPEGLAIWYVDEERGYDSPVPSGFDYQYFIRLMQADNKDEMHDDYPNAPDVRGDLEDLYGNANKSFPGLHPFRWKDGGEFGINITNISSPGATMTFNVNPRPNTIIAKSDIFGTISPKGTLGVANGESKSFSLIPNPGYEVDVLKVNGAAVTATNPYPATASGTKTVSVSFKRKSPVAPLSAPWQKAVIGSISSSDLAVSAGNGLYLETYGNATGGNEDNLTYVYQPLTGNGTFIVHLADYNTIPNARTGIMIRESLNPGAAYWALAKYNQGGAIPMLRSVTGGSTRENPENSNKLHTYELHNWLKIIRNGDYFAAYTSKDGITWNDFIGDEFITMSSQAYIGVFTKGADVNFPSIATFDNFSMSVNPVPYVSITSPANNALLASRTFTINASAAPFNSNGSISKVEFYNGETLLGSDNTAPFSFTWTNAPGGLQTLVAKATDNSFSKGISQKIVVDVPCIFTEAEITGTIIGTTGSWAGEGNTRDKVFDNDITTFFDAPADTAWVGYAIPKGYKVTGIKFYPREGATWRMPGGKFQGSNTADFSSGVTDLYTVTAEPRLGWVCTDITNTSSFKYIRYVCPPGGFGNVAEIKFYGVAVNTAPTVSFVSPASGSTFAAPATVNIEASATDTDGSIAKVAFYNGSSFLGNDLTAPFTFTLTNLAAGSYDLIAYATDDNGAVSAPAVRSFTVIVSTADITGPDCGSSNNTLSFELSASKRTNATGYNWWYTGSSQSITPVTGSPYIVNIATGSNFGAGEVCVGINYIASPWYASYCKTITKCTSRTGDDVTETSGILQSVVYPNPSEDLFYLSLAADAESVSIVNNLGETVYLNSELREGDRISFGSGFTPGVYSITIRYGNGLKEVKRMVKVK
jgi:M6 family metalloprotease-like protein